MAISHKNHTIQENEEVLDLIIIVGREDPETIGEKGWALAINARKPFFNKPFSNEHTQKMLEILASRFIEPSVKSTSFKPIEITIGDKTYHYELDLNRIHGSLEGYGLTKNQIRALSLREKILLDACISVVEYLYLTPILLKDVDTAFTYQNEIREKNKGIRTEESAIADKRYEAACNNLGSGVKEFHKYMGKHFAKQVNDLIANACYGIDKYLEKEKPSSSDIESEKLYLEQLRSEDKSHFYKEIILHALLKNEKNTKLKKYIEASLEKPSFEIARDIQLAMERRFRFSANKSNEIKFEDLLQEYNSIISNPDDDRIAVFENKLPSEIELKYNFPLDESDKIKMMSHSGPVDIDVGDFLSGLAYVTNSSIENFQHKNAYGNIKLSVKFKNDDAEINASEIPFLQNLNLNKNDKGYYEFYFKNDDPGKTSKNPPPHLCSVEITDENAEIAQLKLPVALAVKIVELLKKLKPGHHEGLKIMQDSANRISAKGWDEDEWKKIMHEAKHRISAWSFTSHFKFFGISSSHSRHPDADLIYHAIAQLETNPLMYKEVGSLEELILIQQKQSLINQFNDEIKHLTPLLFSADELTLFKMNAYRTAIESLNEVSSSTAISEILNSDTKVKDEKGKECSFTIHDDDGKPLQTYTTISAAMYLQRGHFAARSAKIWRERITNYETPDEILSRLSQQENNPKLRQ